MAHITIILGTVRPNRFGGQVADWLKKLTADYKQATFTVVDLAELNLPFMDEPDIPMYGNYAKGHTKKWAEIIDKSDGFIVISPEYNHSYSPALKNAFDFLWAEWLYKPLAFVSYGATAGGARGVEHLRGVAGQLRMYDMGEHVIIPDYFKQLDEKGVFTPDDEQLSSAHSMTERLIFWAEQFKEARVKLAQKQ